jgi:DNA-cytosine methyltransferase
LNEKVAQKARKVGQLKRKMSDLSKQQNAAQGFKKKAKADNTVLKLGGDCDGLCTAAVALETMGVKFEHVFASEKDCAARSVLYGNHDVTKVYKDCSSMSRSASRTPKCNVYVAGPPCQPWSRAGKNQGYGDDANRGCVLLDVIAYIGSRTPTVFILEEVPNLAYQHKEHFEEILATLNGFMRYGKPIYKVEWAILNTLEHGGLPQNRKRLYMVGIRADLLTSEFKWPDAIPPVSIHDVLDPPHKKDVGSNFHDQPFKPRPHADQDHERQRRPQQGHVPHRHQPVGEDGGQHHEGAIPNPNAIKGNAGRLLRHHPQENAQHG